MDKVKVALEIIKKHHFWVLCVVIVVVGVMASYAGTSSNTKQYGEQKGSIETLFGSLKKVLGRVRHPNPEVIAARKKETEILTDEVFNSWRKLYTEQKKNNPLPSILGERFKKDFEELEAKKWEGELSNDDRFQYMQFIDQYVPTLFDDKGANIRRPKYEQPVVGIESAGAEDLAAAQGAGLGGQEEEKTEVEMVGIVDWDKDDRDRLMADFRWERTPETQEVRLAQEDLWVYEALVRVIRNTNKYEGYSRTPCTASHSANIKRIFALEIGKRAVESSRTEANTVVRLGDDVPDPTGGGSSPSQGVDLAAGAGEAGQEILAGRYVDPNGNPLEAGAKQPYAEYKIMRIRMKLVMNQMMVPKLLVECANSSMPIEVHRLRLWPDQGTGPLDLTREDGGAEPTGARSGGAAYFDDPAHGAVGGVDPLAAKVQLDDADMPVEIEGFIYIYEYPDRTKVGTGAASKKPDEKGEGEEGEGEEGEGTEGEGEGEGEAKPPEAGPTPPTPAPKPAPPSGMAAPVGPGAPSATRPGAGPPGIGTPAKQAKPPAPGG